MLLVDVERHTHHIAIFAAALRLRASVVSPARGREKDRSNSNNSVDAVSCDAGPAAATAARRSSLTRLRSLDSTKSRVELLLLPDGAGDDDAPAAPLTCVEASTLYMALHAHARHISATFSVVMSLQLANMLLSTTVSALVGTHLPCMSVEELHTNYHPLLTFLSLFALCTNQVPPLPRRT
jgi:hypothetical protein